MPAGQGHSAASNSVNWNSTSQGSGGVLAPLSSCSVPPGELLPGADGFSDLGASFVTSLVAAPLDFELPAGPKSSGSGGMLRSLGISRSAGFGFCNANQALKS